MEPLFLQDIFIYPIKSLGGISVEQSLVQKTGLQYDRRWMLVDNRGKFLSQRTFAQMALLQVSLEEDGLQVTHKQEAIQPHKVRFEGHTGKEMEVQIWDDVCTAVEVDRLSNEWFSAA